MQEGWVAHLDNPPRSPVSLSHRVTHFHRLWPSALARSAAGDPRSGDGRLLPREGPNLPRGQGEIVLLQARPIRGHRGALLRHPASGLDAAGEGTGESGAPALAGAAVGWGVGMASFHRAGHSGSWSCRLARASAAFAGGLSRPDPGAFGLIGKRVSSAPVPEPFRFSSAAMIAANSSHRDPCLPLPHPWPP